MRKKSILLLVDDNSLERVITLLLKQADYQVISKDEASALVKNASYGSKRSHDIDAVISCVQDSSIENQKAISLIRSKYNSVPVMAIIPYGSEKDDVEMLKKNGCASILHSPFEPDELFGSLGDVFQQGT